MRPPVRASAAAPAAALRRRISSSEFSAAEAARTRAFWGAVAAPPPHPRTAACTNADSAGRFTRGACPPFRICASIWSADIVPAILTPSLNTE
eukprot:CAMPEP_0183340376 /NCGR_PEP_ID=MMETSP0164_2-20130417/6947_1 /TAXON_ID=221442 /ORGANISM="Coccolithus pelagicus ssp braarudi, Strain PLY182g" /LENGTH=92 /DNA_ID=CAMNT_0025510497 /DNA_START=140 /DNA_END=418 /DNA_ORIENTATION=+